MTPATNSDDMRNARPIAEGSERGSSERGRPEPARRPLPVELRFETLEPRGEIAVGMSVGTAPALPRVVTAHGENPRDESRNGPGNPPKPGAP